jgi:hypothetical protein
VIPRRSTPLCRGVRRPILERGGQRRTASHRAKSSGDSARPGLSAHPAGRCRVVPSAAQWKRWAWQSTWSSPDIDPLGSQSADHDWRRGGRVRGPARHGGLCRDERTRSRCCSVPDPGTRGHSRCRCLDISSARRATARRTATPARTTMTVSGRRSQAQATLPTTSGISKRFRRLRCAERLCVLPGLTRAVRIWSSMPAKPFPV